MSDVVARFLKAPTEERLAMARDAANAADLKAYLGATVFGEYQAIAARALKVVGAAHLAPGAPKNLLFIPGVMGSLLQNIEVGGVWWIDVFTRHHIDDLGLAPDGTNHPDPRFKVAPFNVHTRYEPFLAAVLEQPTFGHEVFAYDWRKPLLASVAALRDKVVAMHATNGGKPVHLVAHSMGGLLVRAALMRHGDELWPSLGRIAYLGTPHYGAPAIAGYLKNHFWGFDALAALGLFLSRSTFRSLWGPLGLLPAPRGVYPGTRPNDVNPWRSDDPNDPYPHPCVNFDLYRVDPWQLGLTTVAEQARLQMILDAAAAFHAELYQSHLNLTQDRRNRMAVFAGVGYKTLFRLAYAPQFFGLWERMEKVTARQRRDLHREGDGTVPLASAKLEYVPTYYARAKHDALPNIPAVYHAVFRWLNNQSPLLPTTSAGALDAHLAGSTGASKAPHLDGTARGDEAAEDPGRWDLAPPSQEHLDELRRKLDAGQMPEFLTVSLL